MRTLTGSRFFDGVVLHGPTRLTLDPRGVVVDITSHAGPTDHHLLSPALVDLQMNGWRDTDVASADAEGLARLDTMLWDEGTGHWLGTIVSAPVQQMERTLSRLETFRGAAPGMLGIHTEGPFLGARPGAHDRRVLVDVDLGYIDRLPSSVLLVTMAAENPGAPEATARLGARGVRVSVGHSAPTRAEWNRILDSGAVMVTHLFNGMSGIHHRDGGVALWSLVDDRVTCGIIADGHHVADEALRLAFAAKPGGIVLVSDSVAWTSPAAAARGVTNATGVAALPDGTLAGSTTSLLGCLRHAVFGAGVDLATALAAATTIPARLVGRPDITKVAVGHGCDIIALDEEFRLTERSRHSAAD